MRYRKKEIGCEVRCSELDMRALEYIEEFEKKCGEEARKKSFDIQNEQDILLTRYEKNT